MLPHDVDGNGGSTVAEDDTPHESVADGGDDRNTVVIQMKKCPRCSTVIRRNCRYGTIINQTLADIEAVKKLTIRSIAQSGEELSNFKNELKEEYNSNYCEGKKIDRLSSDHAVAIDYTLKLRYRVETMTKDFDKQKLCDKPNLVHNGTATLRAIKQFKALLKLRVYSKKQLESLLAWTKREHKRLSEQQAREASLEHQRVSLLVRVTQLLQRVHLEAGATMKRGGRRTVNATVKKLLSEQVAFNRFFSFL